MAQLYVTLSLSFLRLPFLLGSSVISAYAGRCTSVFLICICCRRLSWYAARLFLVLEIHSNRPSGEGGNGPSEGKFTKFGGKVNIGVLSSKLNVIRAKKGPSASF